MKKLFTGVFAILFITLAFSTTYADVTFKKVTSKYDEDEARVEKINNTLLANIEQLKAILAEQQNSNSSTKDLLVKLNLATNQLVSSLSKISTTLDNTNQLLNAQIVESQRLMKALTSRQEPAIMEEESE